ncbi:MAG: MotA/TolQ/ExbB proton channel family protein [Planctomyces sp.]|nr:MotA/TolQ/ExbB proton channel family protein [Planctomyces sp.]
MVTLLTGLVTAAGTLSAQPPGEPAAATDQNATSGASAADVGQPASGAGTPSSQATPTETAIPTGAWEVATAMGIPFSAAFAVASVIALWSAIERLVMLRQRRVIPRAFVDRFLMHLRTGRMEKVEALTVCQQNQSPIADVFMHGVRKWGKPSVEIEQAIIDGGERQVSLLKKRLRILNGVATITPLVGLLGTVVGMIQSFNKIAVAQAMGQSQVLAEGIALALLTTAAGLFIAIPALTAYMYLAGKVDGLVMEMDRLGQELVYLISAEALRERAVQPTESKPRKPATTPAAHTESPSA